MSMMETRPDPAKVLSANDFLRELRDRGVLRLSRVTFRKNRSTLWSITQRGTVLNVHTAYRAPTPSILDAFAVIAREGGIGSRETRRAAAALESWPPLASAIHEARQEHTARNDGMRVSCCATPAQRAYLVSLYRYFNQTRFAGQLPLVPVRLSRRMRSALGHMLPGETVDGVRTVREIALNADLMLEGNGAERIDTLLHEMAHVADYLESGGLDHGASWRAWARRVGCQPTTLYERPVRFRARRDDPVERVPPLPAAVAGITESRSEPVLAASGIPD